MAVRPAHRQIGLLAACLLLFSAGAYWIYGYRQDNGSMRAWPVAESDGTASSYAPVLGAKEDPARLYYPPVSATQLPVANYNKPPAVRVRTPLFVAFTQNNGMLIQTVMSWIAVGWPPEDIIVVDNSGTLDANSRGELSEQNSFYLDYKWLRSIGVSILQTPTLLTFAQLQNFFLRTSIAQDWPYFFWSHMDIVALGDEDEATFTPFYQRVLAIVEDAQKRNDWALKWFSYDALTMVNVDAWRKIGQWDPWIPYYHADCDAYSRMVLSGYNRGAADVHAGTIYDLAGTVENLEKRLFPQSQDEKPNSKRFQDLKATLQQMEKSKKESKDRNTWQQSHVLENGRSEMWSFDPKGFRYGWWQTAEKGQQVYRNKWGTMECNLDGHGVELSQMWKSVHR